MIMNKKTIFLLVILIQSTIYAQNMHICAGDVCYDNSSQIEIPILAKDFIPMKGFNATLDYNEQLFTFTAFTNYISYVAYTTVVNDPISGKIFIDFKNNTTFNMGNDTILMLYFDVNQPIINNVSFQWDTAVYLSTGAVFFPLSTKYGTLAKADLITEQPSDLSSCVNEHIVFTIATENATVYKWEVSADNGLSWAILDNSTYFYDTDTDTLKVFAKDFMNMYMFRCRVGYEVCQVYSSTVVLEVEPNIVQHPSDNIISVGETAVFSVLGTGSNVTYLWEVSIDNGISWSSSYPLANLTTPQISIVNPPASWHGYRFRCLVSGLCAPPADTTQAAALWIGSAGVENYQDRLTKVSVYPNPVNDFFMIQSDINLEGYSICIYDLNGKIVLSLSEITSDSKIYVKGLSKGTYFCKIFNSTHIYNNRILVY